MFVELSQVLRPNSIIINTDQIISIRKKNDGNYHISLPNIGIDISDSEWDNLKDQLVKMKGE